MSDAVELDKCRANAARLKTRLRNYEHVISDLTARLAAAEVDAGRYRYIKKGNQWIVAATQTGVHVDGGDLDDLIDAEMEQKR